MTLSPGAIVQCALDGCEATWEWSAWKDSQRFCSQDCAAAAQCKGATVRKGPLVPCQNAGCQMAFRYRERDYLHEQRFCSWRCGNLARGRREAAAKASVAVAVAVPLDSISDQAPEPKRLRLRPYEARCLQCGDVAGSWAFDEDRYRLLAQAGWIPTERGGYRDARCLRCGGLLLIEPLDMGGVHSAVEGHKVPSRIAA